ncbi:major capsid protein [Bacillus thuringiensis serovar tolworthi]|uniref:Major capsid protein n=1 Tax=Bacillus thuringiensis subsp. tolworthi TaxID=1442 RepID=A0A9W4A795_BACTO|nr:MULTISPECIES: phage major capsid protein [Bacillus cereus group]MEB8714961.1 phage major capsid protein [Bacillus cereus]MRB05598.1 phage major capsid protein [Bacillus thuringiensis]MEB9431084.1 phage major capsid protein [Bacillus cereus]MEB9482573.1 phage major capsid protein [Bacillus cereus]MEB9590291.1 phage major capsid protein [Bacillus cereus]
MNKQLLLALQKRSNERLVELRTQVENPELRAEDLPAIQEEIDEINKQLQEVADALANLEDDGEGEEGNEDDEDGAGESGTEGSGEGGEGRTGNPEGGENRTGLTAEQRQSAMAAIATGLSTRGHKTTKKKEKEIRSAFANFVVGRISEAEARSLGIEAGNGSVTIPEVIASEIITYAQEENLLRKYGTRHKTNGNVKYPVLVKKASANVNKKERGSGNEIPETDIEFDEILLDPAEFDALATVTKKLMKMSGVNVEDIVIEELKKAYVRKETNYMFNGDDKDNENPGALAKKAVKYYESETIDINAAGYSQKLLQQLVKLKGQPVTEVLKKSMWIVNRAALTVLEGMTDTTGRPLLHTAVDGVGYKLLGHQLDFTDAANGIDPTKPVFYFGDFKAFHIQDVIGAMELEKKVELFSRQNKVGFQIYNLLDGQLVYSPFEPAVYRYEVGATKPGA